MSERHACTSETWRKLLGLYLDGEATPSQEARVRTHLADCAACRRELELFRFMGEAIASLPGYEAPPELAPAVLSRTVRKASPLSLRIYSHRPILRFGLLGAMAASFMALVLWGFNGVLSVVTSPASAILRAMTARAAEAYQGAIDLVDTLGVVDIMEKVVRALAEAGRIVLQSPPPDLVLAAVLAILFVFLVGARAVALHTQNALPAERSVNHARLPL